MLVYDKFTTPRLYGNYEGNIPTSSDPSLTYKDGDGVVLTDMTVTTQLVDGGSSRGIQRIKRVSDNKDVNVYIGDNLIIGDGPKFVVDFYILTPPAKLLYTDNELTSYEGLTAHVEFNDGTSEDLEYGDERLTYSIPDGMSLTELESYVSVAGTGYGTVYVSYGESGMVDMFDIGADVDPGAGVLVCNITQGPNQSTYVVNTDPFDPTGIEFNFMGTTPGGEYSLDYLANRRPYIEGGSFNSYFGTTPYIGQVFDSPEDPKTGRITYKGVELVNGPTTTFNIHVVTE